MARVELSLAAVEDLDGLIRSHSLPKDTRARVQASLGALSDFPRLGRELGERWAPMRFVLGPWRWMVLVYTFEESRDRVVVATIQDGRSSSAARPG